jgi:hypothetical protein
MTTVRTLPAHEVVRRTYPRPPPEEKDEVAMATGKSIDGTLAQFGYESRQGRRPTATAMRALAESLLDDALGETGATVPPAERERILGQVRAVLQAYRRSEILGLARPRTRVILIDGTVGVYAQPDFWDGVGRIYEMKSYPAIPPSPDNALQLRLFQLAYPQFETVLVCFNRHADPVEMTSAVIAPPSLEETNATLRAAYALGKEFGMEKVLEYMPGPFIPYALPGDPA